MSQGLGARSAERQSSLLSWKPFEFCFLFREVRKHHIMVGASLIAQLVKNLPAIQFESWVGKIRWRRGRLPTPVFLDFPGGSAHKESTCNVGDLGSILGLGRSPGHGNLFQYSCLENHHGQRSLVGYSPWGHKELDSTEQLSTAPQCLLLNNFIMSRTQCCY